MRRGLLLWSLLFLVSCAPVEKEDFKLGANNWLGYQPFFAADALNMWDREEISLVELASATEVMRALRVGALDGGLLTLDEAISVVAGNQRLKIVLVVDFQTLPLVSVS